MLSYLSKVCPLHSEDCKRLFKGSGFIGSAEIINRVTRIATIVALSWTMEIVEFGIAAAILTIYELIRVLTQNGLGTQVVVADDQNVNHVSNVVYKLNWYVAIFLAVLQLAIAYPIAVYFNSTLMGLGLVALSVVYLIYPLSMVHVYRAQRENKWKQVSAAIAGQAAVDNLLTAVLAFAGFGIWAVVIPKLVVAPLWVLFHRKYTKWTPEKISIEFKELKQSFLFGAHILGSEVLNVMRAHGDKLFVGIVLGPKALGLYAFASNIGNGITISLSTTLGNAVVLPFMRKGRDQGNIVQSYHQTLLLMLMVMLPIVVAQAVLAPVYVPLVFGEKWVPVIPLLVILALSALARPIQVATSQSLRANGETEMDFKINLYMTVLFFLGMIIGLQWGLIGIAVGIWISMFLSSFVIFYMGQKSVSRQEANFESSSSVTQPAE